MKNKLKALIAVLALLVASLAISAPADAYPQTSVKNIGTLPLTIRMDAGYNVTLYSQQTWNGNVRGVQILAGQCVYIPAIAWDPICAAKGGLVILGTNLYYAKRTR